MADAWADLSADQNEEGEASLAHHRKRAALFVTAKAARCREAGAHFVPSE